MELEAVPAVFIRKPDGSRGDLIETGDLEYLLQKYDRHKDIMFGSKAILKDQKNGDL